MLQTFSSLKQICSNGSHQIPGCSASPVTKAHPWRCLSTYCPSSILLPAMFREGHVHREHVSTSTSSVHNRYYVHCKLLSTPLKLTIRTTHDPVTHRWKPFGLNSSPGEFPGGLMVRIQCFLCRGPGSIPSKGTEIPQATQHSQRANPPHHFLCPLCNSSAYVNDPLTPLLVHTRNLEVSLESTTPPLITPPHSNHKPRQSLPLKTTRIHFFSCHCLSQVFMVHTVRLLTTIHPSQQVLRELALE